MKSDKDTNDDLNFYYEPRTLKCHTAYKKKEMFNMFQRSKTSDKNSMVSVYIKCSEGIFEFLPLNSGDLCHSNIYRDSFLPQRSIPVHCVRNVVFHSKNSEKAVNRKEVIQKNYRGFTLYCWDYRVLCFHRPSKSNAKVSDRLFMKFYQNLVNFIFSNRMNSLDITNNSIQKEFCFYATKLGQQIDVVINSVKCSNILIIDEQLLTQEYNRESQQIVCTNNPEMDALSKCFVINSEKSWFLLNNKDITEAFDKLYCLCTPRNKAEFKPRDKKWLSRLSETEWLIHLNQYLVNTNTLLEHLLTFSNSCVHIFMPPGNDNFDISNLLLSLTQLCCSRCVRTVYGFLGLVEKYWIKNGIFEQNYVTFSLFLDAVYQFLRSYPSKFQFTEEFLICLHDLLHIVVRDPSKFSSTINDLFVLPDDDDDGDDGKTDDKSYLTENENDFPLRTIKWDTYYIEEVSRTFYNKLYDEPLIKLSSHILYPPSISPWQWNEVFWKKMYLRWIPYLQIEGGSFSLHHSISFGFKELYPAYIYSNYPFSLQFDERDNDEYDDIRSIASFSSDMC